MASTYDNSLRLELIATGEAASTWGDKTNVNLTAIAAAFGYATQDGFAADANATTTVADGAADPARALYFKITSSATLTATRTLTIAPNTISRVMWIENATTGSQSIAISQGSGANVTIPAGKTAVVYLDGAGAGAAVVDAMASLNIDGSISAGAATFDGTATMGGLTVDAVNSSFKSTGATAISIIDTDVTNDPFKFNIENGGRDGRISVWQDIIFSNTGAGETVRIDTSGNLLVGTTSTSSTVAGLVMYGGASKGVTTQTYAGRPSYINRLSTDGDIIEFAKDGTTVGSIGTGSGLLTIGTGTGNLLFENALVAPCSTSSLGASNGVVDLGASTRRFKDLYLSGTVNAGAATFSGTVTMDGLTVDGSTTGSVAILVENTLASGDADSDINLKTASSGGELRISFDHPSATSPSFIQGDDQLIFAPNGTVAMSLDSSGNLLVGTTSSSGSKLYVSSNAGSATVGDFRNSSPTGSGMYIAAGDTASQYALRVADYANNHLMTVDGRGNLGLGTTTPAYQLTVSSNPSFWEAGLQTEVVGGNQVLKIVSDAFGGGGRTGSIEFHVDAVTTTPALKIATGGGIISIVSSASFSYDARQTGTNGYGILSRFSAAGLGYMYAAYLDSPGAYKFYVTTDGAVYGNGTYGTISDIKLKENIVPASSQWDDVKAIQLKNYSLIADNLEHADQLGVIAQDLEASGMGKLIDTLDDIDGDGASLGTVTKHVKYSVLHLKALGALQEAMAKIEDLTARLEALEGA